MIFSLGAFFFNFPLMQVGRFVFGIGGESLAVAQNTYAVSCFKGKELNMVFGFQLSVARVGSTLNFISMAPFFNWFLNFFNPHVALGWTLLAAGGSFCLMSFVCALVRSSRHTLLQKVALTVSSNLTRFKFCNLVPLVLFCFIRFILHARDRFVR